MITELAGHAYQVGDEFLNYTIHKPVGVAGLIMPWNAPLILTMASGFLMIGAGYVVRMMLARQIGLEAAGLYAAAWTLGGLYVNFVVQGGSPGASEYVGDARYMRDEVSSLSHERGTVGISTRGRDTGDAQWFINMVDNPRLDHEHTVFAQVLNGLVSALGTLKFDVGQLSVTPDVAGFGRYNGTLASCDGQAGRCMQFAFRYEF